MSWESWSGLATAQPAEERRPVTEDDVVAAVQDARDRGQRVKMVGTGHSFTPIAVTDGVLLHPTSLTGITAVDRGAGTVTVRAGTTLRDLNEGLLRLGLSLHNMGDIQEQTVAGAISTGTHGTGGRVASLSAQVRAVDLVDGTGKPRSIGADDPLLDAVRLGLGGLGVLTGVTLAVEELFTLAAHERPMRWDEAVDRFDEHVAAHDHFEMYWWPHTDRLLTKADDRTDEPPAPLSRRRAWWDDQLLANTVLGGVQRLGHRHPALIRPLSRATTAVLGERRFSDAPFRVFTSRREFRFREMEHAVPREAGVTALRELRALVERSEHRIGMPVEVRTAPADDAVLSPASGRDVVWIAVHVYGDTDHRAYFADVEALLRAHDGRPHWGKLHTRTAADLAPAYPRWQEYAAARDALDPDRVLTNDHLERVVGP